MSNDGMYTNDFWAAQLRAQQIQEDTGLSPADQAAMPLDEWSRLAYGQTPAQAALAAFHAQEQEQPASHGLDPLLQEYESPAAPVDPYAGLDPDSPEFFHAWRANRVSGGENKGIFDSVSSQSDAYRAAARAHTGRTGYGQRNTVEPPRIERAFINHDERIDRRSAAQRLSTPGNAWLGQ